MRKKSGIRCIEIENILRERIGGIESMEVKDESYKHQGHMEEAKGGGTHIHIKISAEEFRGKTRLERQRLVLGYLEEMWSYGLHALSIEATIPKSIEKVES